ncbi:MAG: phosphatidate cytidylyltransferase [bacterium]|nr:phosphatidate cytidylyltransferase [bacterium]
MSALGKRVLTTAIALPIALAVVFYAPGPVAFAAFLAVFFVATMEFLPMARVAAPSAPLKSLLVYVPLAAIAGFLLLREEAAIRGWWLVTGVGLAVTIAACTTLLGGAEVRDGLASMGILAFAVPYFAVPPLCISWLQAQDPWLLLALLAIVWIGDTAAWSIGTAIGRHRLAPTVSPKKSWEGAVAGFVAAPLVMAIWSLLRLGEVRPALLGVAALTAVAAQLGDLVESVIKRGAGIKDSSNWLPGHGGFFDRMDALMLAAPIYVACLLWLGLEGLIPS